MIEQTANGTFEHHEVLLLPSPSSGFLIGGDEELVVVAFPLEIRIFKKDAQTHNLVQTLAYSALLLALSPDGQELFSCSNTLRVHRHNGTQFVLTQTINLSFTCFEVNFMSGLLEVHGQSS